MSKENSQKGLAGGARLLLRSILHVGLHKHNRFFHTPYGVKIIPPERTGEQIVHELAMWKTAAQRPNNALLSGKINLGM